jgi:hypothetical protein
VRLGGRKADFAPSIVRTVDLLCCDPTFVVCKSLLDQRYKGVIEAIAGAIFRIQSVLEIFSGGTVTFKYETKLLSKGSYRFSTSVKNSAAESRSFC